MSDDLSELAEYIKNKLPKLNDVIYRVSMYTKYHLIIPYERSFTNILIKVEKLINNDLTIYESCCSLTNNLLDSDQFSNIFKEMINNQIKILSKKIINNEFSLTFTGIESYNRCLIPLYDVI